MDDIRQTAIDQFRAYLERRQFSAHTIASYTLDLRLFFREAAGPLAQASFREVDHFVEWQHQHGRSWATINRRLKAPKHFFDFCLDQQYPGERAKGYVFWNRKRHTRPLSVKAIQKKMERYAKAAGIPASCHRLRRTFASSLLEHGAEVIAIREFLGHSQMTSSERYAKVSSRKIKQAYLRTMQKILKQGQV